MATQKTRTLQTFNTANKEQADASLEKLKLKREEFDTALEGIKERLVTPEIEQAVAGFIVEITQLSNVQANGIAQIDKGIGQVPAVVQSNSLTAEESAAATQELSGQAEVLKRHIGQVPAEER